MASLWPSDCLLMEFCEWKIGTSPGISAWEKEETEAGCGPEGEDVSQEEVLHSSDSVTACREAGA